MPLIHDSVDMTPQGAQMAALKNLYVLDSITRWTAEAIVDLLTDEEKYLALQIVHNGITGSSQRHLQFWSSSSSLLTISVPGIMDTHEHDALKETLASVGHELYECKQTGHGSHMVLSVSIVFQHERG